MHVACLPLWHACILHLVHAVCAQSKAAHASLPRPPSRPAGPTNSGKTYSALQSLAAAQRGVYCAPLRLLAMEVYETLNHRGVLCDLVRAWCSRACSSHVAQL